MVVAKRIEGDSGPAYSVVVVGAGISGLATSYLLMNAARNMGWPLKLTVLDAANRAGGVIRTLANEYGLMEQGPEAFVTHKPAALNLINQLGLGDRLMGCGKASARTFVARGDILHALPEGFIMFAPTRLAPLARSPLFSLRGKMRIALDLFLPARRDDEDESLADFVCRRLGREALDRLAEPLISGIYSTDPERLSAKCAVPRLKELESKYGSIVRGLMQSRQSAPAENAISRSPFLTLDEGMQVLTDELSHQLGADVLQLESTAIAVCHGLEKRWRVRCKDGRQFECDFVVLSTPASVTAKLIQGISPSISEELAGIEYGCTTMVSYVFRREAIGHPLDASGFVVPSSDGRATSACSFSSIKFSGRAQDGLVLLRAFSKLSAKNDDFRTQQIVQQQVLKDLRHFLNIDGAPLFSTVSTPSDGIPRYTVGHKDRVDRIFRSLRQHPGLLLAGNSYTGIGIPDCINSAEAAVQSIVELVVGDPSGARMNNVAAR